MSGTFPLNRDLEAAYNAVLMIIFPTNAKPISDKLLLTIEIKALNLVNSCVRTVFIDYVYSTGYFLTISAKSYSFGKSDRIVFTTFVRISSCESPLLSSL